MWIRDPIAFFLALAAVLLSAVGIFPTFYAIMAHVGSLICVFVLYQMLVRSRNDSSSR